MEHRITSSTPTRADRGDDWARGSSSSMGLGVDMEAAARPADYYEIFADPRDDEAPPVWGYRAPSCWSRMDSEDRAGFTLLAAVTCLFMALLGGIVLDALGHSPPSFAVGIAGAYGGIDLGDPGRVVSPAFGVTLRANGTCVDRADVVVAYASVALGWARAEPRGCEEKRWAEDVEVVARREGAGLPEHVRNRMASGCRRSGTLELDVDVDIFGSSGSRRAAGEFPQKVMSGKVRLLDGQKSWSLPFLWYALDPVV